MPNTSSKPSAQARVQPKPATLSTRVQLELDILASEYSAKQQTSSIPAPPKRP